MQPSDTPDHWDAIVIGGALSGAATALLLLRREPGRRVLIIERSAAFSRRVGESTVEISAFFLGRVLGLTEHLHERHLVKQGLRFWFANERTKQIDDCSETGPGYNVRFPGFQVDRAVLDEEVLAQAVAAGATLARPAKVTEVTLNGRAGQTVEWQDADGHARVSTARWVVDASGFAALLARKHGWLETNTAHPIAACWSRWSGVKNLDSREFAEKHPAVARRPKAIRYTATNHIVGKGWWSWWIPLKGGDYSVGIVFDQRIVELESGGRLGDRLKEFLCEHPAGRELLENAHWHERDVHFRRHCAYASKVMAGDGFVLVGDAAGFMDPFYSPGMDWISHSTTAAAALIDVCLRGRPAAPRVEQFNERFTRSYRLWFDAIYRDKYYYMGDQELMTLAFRLDLGLYYLGVVARPFKQGEAALETPPFTVQGGEKAARLIALYNRRFAAMARDRMERGVWGRTNDGRYVPFISYQLDWHLPRRLLGVSLSWLRLELTEGWRTWFRNWPESRPLPARPPRASVDRAAGSAGLNRRVPAAT